MDRLATPLRHLALGIIVLLAVGCNGSNSEPSNSTIATEAFNDIFSISIPDSATYRYERSDTSIAYTTFEAPTTEYRHTDYSIKVYPPTSLNTQTCSPSLTGSSSFENTEDINDPIPWGKVDYFELYPGGDFPKGMWPTCRPFVDGFAYALCSEKDGKTVLICISQMTDNPQLAEEIFKTFRWTE